MPLAVVSGIIPAGEPLSNDIDCSAEPPLYLGKRTRKLASGASEMGQLRTHAAQHFEESEGL
jgi:hypothetical protein